MSLIRKFSVNAKGRDFIVGDIHGAFDLLLKAMRLVNFNYDTKPKRKRISTR